MSLFKKQPPEPEPRVEREHTEVKQIKVYCEVGNHEVKAVVVLFFTPYWMAGRGDRNPYRRVKICLECLDEARRTLMTDDDRVCEGE